MLYLLWELLNIGLFLLFITTCFKATKLLREQAGVLASIVFVAGLLSFVAKSSVQNKEQYTNQAKQWELVPGNITRKFPDKWASVAFEKTPALDYTLNIGYIIDKQNLHNIPTVANASMTGFVSGRTFIPTYIDVNQPITTILLTTSYAERLSGNC